jgi:hypothetical protein
VETETWKPISLDTAILGLILTLSLLYSRYIVLNSPAAYKAIHIVSFFVLAGVAIYFAADFFVQNARNNHLIKIGILGFLILITSIGPQIIAIELRHQSSPSQFITDSAVQTEEAIKMVLKGKNPYAENYYKTPLDDFDHKSPALQHYVYLPMTFLMPLPFYVLIKGLAGWFDLRMVYLMFFVLMLWFLWRIPSNPVFRRCLIIVIALNPEIIYYFVYGTNDIVATACMVASIYLVRNRRYAISALFLAIGLLTKQFVILFLPFYLLYIYGQNKAVFRDKAGSLSPLFKTCGVIALIVAVFAVPVALWNLNAFVDDIIRYPYGTAAASWHIAGWGLSQAALVSGLVKTDKSYFPSLFFYVIILLPLTLLMFWRQLKDNTMAVMLTAAAITIFVFVIVSRFTHNNYFYYATTLLLIAYFGDFASRREVEAAI